MPGTGTTTSAIFFPSELAEGVYNATLEILGRRERMLDYAPPVGPSRGKPPIWITTIGEDGTAVPLAHFTEYDDKGYMVPTGSHPASEAREPRATVPHDAAFRYGVVAAVIAAAAGIVLVLRVHADTAGEDCWAGCRPLLPGLRAAYAGLVTAGFLFVLLPFSLYFETLDGVVIGPPGRPYAPLGPADQFIRWAVAAAGAMLAACYAVYLAWQFVAACRAGTPADPWQCCVTPRAVVALAGLTTALVFAWTISGHASMARDPAAAWAFVERAAAYGSGASPIVPTVIIALGLVVFGFQGLWQMSDMARFRVPVPYPDWFGISSPGCPPRPPAEPLASSPLARSTRRIHESARAIDRLMWNLGWVFFTPAERASVRWRVLWWVALVAVYVGATVWIVQQPSLARAKTFWSAGPLTAWAAMAAFGLLLLVSLGWQGRFTSHPRVGGYCRWATILVLLAVLGQAAVVASDGAEPTWEGRHWNCLFATGFLLLAAMTVVAGCRLYLLGKEVRTITRAIMTVPMVKAFDTLPDKVSRVLGECLLRRRRRDHDLELPAYLIAETGARRHGSGPAPGSSRQFTAWLCELSAGTVEDLAPDWAGRPIADAFGTVPFKAGEECPPALKTRDRAEQFVAIMATLFVAQYLAWMRRLMFMAAVGAGAMLSAMVLYQFEPKRLLVSTAASFTVAVVLLILSVLYHIDRNEMVSRVVRSRPNEFNLNWAFVQQNWLTLIIPLLTLVGVQLAGRLRTLVEPVLGWFK